MQYDAIFFDWDGVVTDSVGIKTECFVEMFSEYGEYIMAKVKKHHLQNGGMSRFDKLRIYYEEFLGVPVSDADINRHADRFASLVMKKILEAPFIPGAVDTIIKQYEKGTLLFVVSGTPTQEIRDIAQHRSLYKYFVDIVGSPKKKDYWVAYFIKKYHLKPERCLFLGDAMADYLAAKNNGVHFIGIKINSCKTSFPENTIVKKSVTI